MYIYQYTSAHTMCIHQYTYVGIYWYTQVYMDMHPVYKGIHAWVYTSLHGNTPLYTNIHGYTPVYMDIIHQFTLVYTSMCMYTCEYWCIPTYIHSCIPMCTNLYPYIHEYTAWCTCMYTGAYPCMPVYTDV